MILPIGILASHNASILAQSPGEEPIADLAGDSAESTELKWSFTPFAFLLSLEGDVAIKTFEVPIDLGIKDILKESETLMPLMGHLEVGSEDWSLFFSSTYVGVNFSEVRGSVGLVDVIAKFDAKLGWFDFGGAVPLIKTSASSVNTQEQEDDPYSFRMDVYGGARLTYINLELETSALIFGIPVGSAKQNTEEFWLDPFIGLRGRYVLNDEWFVNARGDIGGFGVGSDFSWHVMADARYSFEIFDKSAAAFLGYRALGQDYSNGGFQWDMVAHGPIIGLEIRF